MTLALARAAPADESAGRSFKLFVCFITGTRVNSERGAGFGLTDDDPSVPSQHRVTVLRNLIPHLENQYIFFQSKEEHTVNQDPLNA